MISITILIAIITIYLIFRYNRRNFYKHSSKIPGLSSLPLIGDLHNFIDVADMRQTFHKLFEKHGYTFKMWLMWIHLVVIANPKYLKIILNSPNCLAKDKRYHNVSEVIGNGLVTSPVKIWKRDRKLLTPAFSKKMTDSFVEVFIKHGAILVDQLKKEEGKTEAFDVYDYITKCSLDLICETSMGVSVDAQTTNSVYYNYISRVAEIMIIRAIQVWYHIQIIFSLSPIGREYYKIGEAIQEFSTNIINKRTEERELKMDTYEGKDILKSETKVQDIKQKPFLDHLLDIKEHFTYTEIQGHVLTFVGAGSDTVSTTVQYTLVALGMHKDIQKKVREELLEVFGDSDREIDISDLSKLEYLEKVLKETMRLYPPVPLVARSVDEDIDLDDFIIPKGSTAVVAISGVHRNPEYWDDPLKFDPDRFLPEQVAKRHPYCFIPFSAGPRNCIGISYAYAACKVLLIAVLRNYEIDTPIRPETIRFKTEVASKIFDGSLITIKKYK